MDFSDADASFSVAEQSKISETMSDQSMKTIRKARFVLYINETNSVDVRSLVIFTI